MPGHGSPPAEDKANHPARQVGRPQPRAWRGAITSSLPASNTPIGAITQPAYVEGRDGPTAGQRKGHDEGSASGFVRNEAALKAAYAKRHGL